MLTPKEMSLARFHLFVEFLFAAKASWRKITAYIPIMPRKLLLLILVVLSITAAGYAQQGREIADPQSRSQSNLKVFQSLCSNISEHYFDPNFNGADWNKLEEHYRPLAAVADDPESLITIMRQMVAALKTTHLEISLRVDPRAVQQKIGQRIAIKREVIWLNAGFKLKRIGQSFLVPSVISSTPASSVGVRPGWMLTAVNGRAISNDWSNYVNFREGQPINYRFTDVQENARALDIDSGFYITPIVR